MVDQKVIEELNGLPIEEVAGRLGMEVTRHRALCPYHDDHTPSLSFSVSRNRFRCFACGAHGGVIDLARKVLGYGFADACAWLSTASNQLPMTSCQRPMANEFDSSRYYNVFRYPFINDLAADFLFCKRRLSPEVVRRCSLNSFREWLQIPYFDIDGGLVGVQMRYLGDDKRVPRFIFPAGSRCRIYNQQVLRQLKPGDDLYIAEGCSDCWALMSSGLNAIAIPSATMLIASDFNNCQWPMANSQLHIYPDQDAPGEALYQSLRQQFPTIIRHQLPEGCKDYSEYYLQNFA